MTSELSGNVIDLCPVGGERPLLLLPLPLPLLPLILCLFAVKRAGAQVAAA